MLGKKNCFFMMLMGKLNIKSILHGELFQVSVHASD